MKFTPYIQFKKKWINVCYCASWILFLSNYCKTNCLKLIPDKIMSIKRCLFTVNDLTKGNYHTYYYNKLYWSFNISTCSSQNFLRASLKRLLGLATACSMVNLWYWLSLHPGFVSFWCCFTCIPSSKLSYKKEISDNFIVRHCPCSKQQKK